MQSFGSWAFIIFIFSFCSVQLSTDKKMWEKVSLKPQWLKEVTLAFSVQNPVASTLVLVKNYASSTFVSINGDHLPSNSD